MPSDKPSGKPRAEPVQRVQTGIRIETRILKVLKALAESKDMTLGDLIEGIVLHAFEGRLPFDSDTLKDIRELKRIYGLDLSASSSHRLRGGTLGSKPNKAGSSTLLSGQIPDVRQVEQSVRD
jgi:hypothetical protein